MTLEAVYNHPGSGNGCVIFPGCSNCGGWFSLRRGQFMTKCCEAPTSPVFRAMQRFADKLSEAKP